MSDNAKPSLTAAQQAAAVDTIHENMALRSGAGCGKTYVLARRFTELLMSCGDAPGALSRLVALTFTEKAALEMTQRVRKMIADFAAQAASDADRRRLLGYLEQVSEARISTIHRFCAGLLRSHAIEAGVDPGFAVCADNLVVQRMIADAVDEAILRAVEARDAGASELLARMSYDQACEMVRELVDTRTAVDFEKYLDADETLAHWTAMLQQTRREAWREIKNDAQFAAGLDALERMQLTDSSGKLTAKRTELVAAARAILQNDSPPDRQALDAVVGTTVGNVGGNSAAAKECRSRLKDLKEQFGELQAAMAEANDLDAQAAAHLATLSRLAQQATALYRTQKVKAGLLDFNDLLACTDRLLRSSPALRRELSDQIDQLLIDECQDTDPFQLAMLCLLVGAVGETLPAEGRLFIVGDAKQSIYRFRGRRSRSSSGSASGSVPAASGIWTSRSARTARAWPSSTRSLADSSTTTSRRVPVARSSRQRPRWRCCWRRARRSSATRRMPRRRRPR